MKSRVTSTWSASPEVSSIDSFTEELCRLGPDAALKDWAERYECVTVFDYFGGIRDDVIEIERILNERWTLWDCLMPWRVIERIRDVYRLRARREKVQLEARMLEMAERARQQILEAAKRRLDDEPDHYRLYDYGGFTSAFRSGFNIGLSGI